MMQPSDILNIVNDIEIRFPVDTWSINGIHIWPLIRFELKKYFFKQTHPENFKAGICKNAYYIKSIYHFLSGFSKCCYASIVDSRHNASFNRVAPVIFLTYSVHRGLVHNKWLDRFCDPFIECFRSGGLHTLTLESELSTYMYRIPRFSDSIYIQQKVDFIRAQNRFLPRKRFDENLSGLDAFLSYLHSGKYKGLNICIGRLRYYMGIILDMANYFKRIFAAVTPSLAFVVDYYSSLESLGFVIACRQSNIRCIDIQHGTIGAYHLACSGWISVPEGGYELLPNVFWCWTKEDMQEIFKWSKNILHNHRAYDGGNLWLNLWNDPHSEIVRYYDKIIINKKSKISNVKYVVYTVDKYFGFPDWIIEVIKSTSYYLFWWIRMHPSQLNQKDNIRKILRGKGVINFDIDLGTDTPLPALFRHCDVHVTATSSSIKEALYFSVPSVFTHPDGQEHHLQEVASGMAVSAYTQGDLLHAIECQIRKKNALQRGVGLYEDNKSILKRFLNTLDIKLELE